MKLQKIVFLVLALLLSLNLVGPVNARPNLPDSQDEMIRQVLEATRAELGWSDPIHYAISPNGNQGWVISSPTTAESFGKHILISDYHSTSEASSFYDQGSSAMSSMFGSIDRFIFHGYQAFYAHGKYQTWLNVLVDQYFIEILASGPSDTKAVSEVFYRHAVIHGFMRSDGSQDPTPTETLVPTQAATPQPGAAITLAASAENYNPATQVIDNTANFAEVAISGRVVDLSSGAPIAGATIEITSGAAYGSTLSASDGSYSLTAVIAGGLDTGHISELDFALPAKADLTIEVIPSSNELIADGSNAIAVLIHVKDLQGNPLPRRDVSLVLDADAGPGTILPTQATTNDYGVIEAIYTAFKVSPGQDFSTPRHEVLILARDNTSGFSGSATIFVNQYQLTVLHDEFIPACIQCNFPSKFTISISDYWNNPIPNAPLYLEIIGMTSDGTLVIDPNANQNQQEISLTSDTNGHATVFFKWQGSLDIVDAIRQVVIIEETTNAMETKDVNVHALDIGISRFEEAGFTGVTGQQAFLKVYFKERAHPDLLLDRFNMNSPNKLGLQVIIDQFHSDGTNTSLTYKQTGGWAQDEKGLYVKMYTTPHMPYIIPENDGTSWYEVRVDPIIDQDVLLPDLFRTNNGTIIALQTGSPESWLHIWLADGVLTPHNYLGVTVKCVLSFLPGFGDALTIIDTLNQVYNLDVLSLSKSTSQVLTEELQRRMGQVSPGILTKLKASTLNNVVSCVQDAYGVYKQGSVPNPACAKLAALSPRLLTVAREGLVDPELNQFQVDQFVHGFLMDDPTQQALILFGLSDKDFQVLNANGQALDLSETISAENGMVVILYNAGDGQSIRISAHTPFDVAIYQAGPDATRQTLHFNVATEESIIASLNLSGASDTVLNIDKNGDGVADEILAPTLIIHDITRPVITDLKPADGTSLGGKSVTLATAYTDESGIAPDSVRVWLDDIEMSHDASADTQGMSLQVKDLPAGEHHARIEVSDLAGNKSVGDWHFTVKEPTLLELYNIPLGWVIVLGGGSLMLIAGIMIALILIIAKKRDQPEPMQDAQGNWWYDDPKTGARYVWNGQNWQPVQTPSLPAQQLPLPHAFSPRPRKGRGSCLLALLIGVLMLILVLGAVSLVAFKFLPGYSIQPASGVVLKDVLIRFGGGVLAALIGLLMLYGGIKAILSRRMIMQDEYNRQREKRGCAAVIGGILLSLFGLLILAGGLTLASVALYQHVLPWLGF